MLPILPVILLLLLQGPANVERMALQGRLPAVIEAIQRMDAPQNEKEAFVSLLAASQDAELTHALFSILKWTEPAATVTAKPLSIEPTFVAIEPRQRMALSGGFVKGNRSRDGPFPVV
ncbi:MAG: hypothetical protein ACAH95_13980 [Fimbriimonas sp.]